MVERENWLWERRNRTYKDQINMEAKKKQIGYE